MTEPTAINRLIKRLIFLHLAIIAVTAIMATSCAGTDERGDEDLSMRRALEVQKLSNLAQGPDVSVRIEAIVDSMRQSRHDTYYFSAANVLIDQFFNEGKIARAESLAVKMMCEATESHDITAAAIAHRIRGQILYKLSRPEKALAEFIEGRRILPDFPSDLQTFSNAASIDRWLWIAAYATGDNAAMRLSGRRFAENVARKMQVGWRDSTAHFPVTALAFEASEALCNSDTVTARQKINKAASLRLDYLPANAYEQFYQIRSMINAASGDIDAALADMDTLITAYAEFPWFRQVALRGKANLLSAAGRHAEAVETTNRLMELHDSLTSLQNDLYMNDLTDFYRSEINREHRFSKSLKGYAFAAILALLAILLAISLANVRRQRRKNIILIERLRDYDKVSAAGQPGERLPCYLSPIELLDRKMHTEKPYRNPALGRKELAAMLCITPDEVGALIKAERDQTVVGYINSCRAEEARRILESDPEVTVASVAYELGFGTPRTMQRVFGKHFGMSPTQFRELSKESKRH